MMEQSGHKKALQLLLLQGFFYKNYFFYKRPIAPASAVSWNGQITQIHSGLNHKKPNMITVETPNIIQSRPLLGVYSSLLFAIILDF